MRSTAPGSLHLPAVPRTPAHSLCRYRSRRGGDREAPPWGRSRWSGRKSLGRCAPAAASEPHTCQRRGSSASPRVEEGAPGGRRAVPVAAERELLGRLAPASLGNRLPPAGRAQGLAPCLLGANRIFLLRVGSTPMGCGFPLHPCVGFGYVNSLSYRNQAALPCFRCTPRVFSESSSLVGPVIHHLNLCTRF